MRRVVCTAVAVGLVDCSVDGWFGLGGDWPRHRFGVTIHRLMVVVPRWAVVEHSLLLRDETAIAEEEHEPFPEAGVEDRTAVIPGGVADDTVVGLVRSVGRHGLERLVAAQALHLELVHVAPLKVSGLKKCSHWSAKISNSTLAVCG